MLLQREYFPDFFVADGAGEGADTLDLTSGSSGDGTAVPAVFAGGGDGFRFCIPEQCAGAGSHARLTAGRACSDNALAVAVGTGAGLVLSTGDGNSADKH